MLQLPEVHSVLASAGQAGAMIAEVASLRETTAGDQDVILPPKIFRHLLQLLANLLDKPVKLIKEQRRPRCRRPPLDVVVDVDLAVQPPVLISSGHQLEVAVFLTDGGVCPVIKVLVISLPLTLHSPPVIPAELGADSAPVTDAGHHQVTPHPVIQGQPERHVAAPASEAAVQLQPRDLVTEQPPRGQEVTVGEVITRTWDTKAGLVHITT